MAVLTNTMLQGTAAISDDAYQIEKSLRFNDPDAGRLSKSMPVQGNRRRWTWAGWVKRGKNTGTTQIIFSGSPDGSNMQTLKITSSDTLYYYQISSGSFTQKYEWTAKLRDHSAWYHLTLVYDSSASYSEERLKLYINGENYVSTATNAASQYEEGFITKDPFYIGSSPSEGNEEFDGYLADVQFIDGLALHPTVFGSFNDAGIWNPKEFALNQINNGTTWSNTLTGDKSGSSQTITSPDRAFDGNTNTYASFSHSSGDQSVITFTAPGDGITGKKVRVFCYQPQGTSGAYEYLSINGGSYVRDDKGWAGVSANGNGWTKEQDIPGGKLTSISLKLTYSGSSNQKLYAIEVDGVILIDSITDPETRVNPNNGTKWSDHTSGGTENNTYVMERSFDGGSGGNNVGARTISGGGIVFEPPGGISYTSRVRMLTSTTGAGDQTVSINDGTGFTVKDDRWVTVASGSGTLNKLAITASASGNSNAYLEQIEIDGHVLLDSTVDNSFHLKFNDTSNDAALGKTSINDRKLTDATGALPYWNTTDDHGEVKGSGARTDSTSNPVLLLPLDASNFDNNGKIDDLSTNARDVGDSHSDCTSKTDQSYFYGSSAYFDGGGDNPWYSNHSDWICKANGWTCEMWIRPDGSGSRPGDLISHLAQTEGWYMYTLSNDRVGVGWNHGSGYVEILSNTGTVKDDVWTHVAAVVHSNTMKLYVNGIVQDSTSAFNSDSQDANTYLRLGTKANNYPNPFQGWMTDLRLYHSTKYTGNFRPPTRSTFTVNNLSGVSVDGSAGSSDFANIKYTGNGGTQTVTTGSFLPGLVWIKNKNSTDDHKIYDVVNGVEKYLECNTDDALTTASNGVTAFTSTGFTTGDHSSQNGNGTEYIATVWKTGGAASSNSDGSITSSVSAGDICSVVTWTGTQANGTVGHGLSKAPEMMWVKSGVDGHNWVCYHKSNAATLKVMLNTNNNSTYAPTWNSTHPTDSVFSVGADDNTNDSGNTMTAYCWTSKDGAAKFGSYTGTGSATATPVQQCGFRPELVIIKGIDTSSGQDFYRWSQASENSLNKTELNDIATITNDNSISNDQSAEALAISFDGFRPKGDSAKTNENGKTYIWAAWSDGTDNGSEIDVLNDTPTNFEDSGTVHGNFCTLNPLQCPSNITLTQGNLQFDTASGSYGRVFGTMPVSSGKWYFEYTVNNANKGVGVGWTNVYQSSFNHDVTTYLGVTGDYCFTNAGPNSTAATNEKRLSGSDSGFGTEPVNGDIIGVLLDLDNTTLSMKLNNSTSNNWGDLTTSLPSGGLWVPLVGDAFQGGHVHGIVNFGQRPFKYTQSGYKALCTQNIDNLFSGNEVNNPSKYFDVLTYVGTGNNDSNVDTQTVSGLSFQPDLIWIKNRDHADGWHHITDAIRGPSKAIYSAGTNVEGTNTDKETTPTSTGFTLEDGQGSRDHMYGDNKYVSWCWDCGTAAVTPSTDGSITPSAQWVNATAGFSISKYTGTGADATVGHGLSAAPEFIIVKNLDEVQSWLMFVKAVGNPNNQINEGSYGLQLNTAGMWWYDAEFWNDTVPTNTVFSLGNKIHTNGSGDNIIAYCWTPIPGFSSFGGYAGSNSEMFIYTGFQPRWIMIKLHSEHITHAGWRIIDTARNPFNDGAVKKKLSADTNEAENGGTDISTSEGDVDILSNGFRITDNHSVFNTNGRTYLYQAFAEHPFKTARAR